MGKFRGSNSGRRDRSKSRAFLVDSRGARQPIARVVQPNQFALLLCSDGFWLKTPTLYGGEDGFEPKVGFANCSETRSSWRPREKRPSKKLTDASWTSGTPRPSYNHPPPPILMPPGPFGWDPLHVTCYDVLCSSLSLVFNWLSLTCRSSANGWLTSIGLLTVASHSSAFLAGSGRRTT